MIFRRSLNPVVALNGIILNQQLLMGLCPTRKA
jgi:hypothetical protein